MVPLNRSATLLVTSWPLASTNEKDLFIQSASSVGFLLPRLVQQSHRRSILVWCAQKMGSFAEYPTAPMSVAGQSTTEQCTVPCTPCSMVLWKPTPNLPK